MGKALHLHVRRHDDIYNDRHRARGRNLFCRFLSEEWLRRLDQGITVEAQQGLAVRGDDLDGGKGGRSD